MDRNSRFIEISSVDSTNNYAAKLLNEQGLADETVILAHSQTGGRGQKGNTWLSENKKNITCSIVIMPHFLPIEKQFFLSVLTSLSIIHFLKTKIDGFSIKWPNDIYYKNLKIGGILVENTISGKTMKNSIIGVGLNINQTEFPEELPNPVSLSTITSEEYNLSNLIEELVFSFHTNYEKLKQGAFQELKNEYLDNLYLFNQSSNFLDNGVEFSGKITGVLDSGELSILDSNGKKRKYMFKEVEFLH